jgi:hypothetical protein
LHQDGKKRDGLVSFSMIITRGFIIETLGGFSFLNKEVLVLGYIIQQLLDGYGLIQKFSHIFI